MLANKLNWDERDAGERLTIIMIGICCCAFIVYAGVFVWTDIQVDGQLKPVSVSFVLIVFAFIAFLHSRIQKNAR